MKIPDIMIVSGGVWDNPLKYRKTSARLVLVYEVEYQRVSCGHTYINGKEIPIEKDTMIFCRPGEIRNTVFEHDCMVETEFIYFIVGKNAESRQFEEFLTGIPSMIRADEEIRSLWKWLFSNYDRSDNFRDELMVYSNLFLLLTVLARKADHGNALRSAESSVYQKTLFEAVRYMNEHIRDHLSMEDIAQHVGYSLSYFNHIFKKFIPNSPYAYFLSLKIMEAKFLLLNTDKGIAQISEELGFCQTNKFTIAFKKATGMTPKQFRQSRQVIYYNE